MSGPEVVVLTRRAEDDGPLVTALSGADIEIVQVPCVRTEELDDPTTLARAIADLGSDDALVLTSRAGAEAVAAVAPRGLDCAVAAVGPSTAERARSRGLAVTFLPSRADGATLARELPLPAGTVTLARSDIADPEPAAILRARGAQVRETVAYRTVAQVNDPLTLRHALAADAVTVVVASPSAVSALAAAAPVEVLRRARFVAIGPHTARAVRDAIGAGATVADDPSPAALARAITRQEALP